MDGPPALKMGTEDLEPTAFHSRNPGLKGQCNATCDARGPRLIAAAWALLGDDMKVTVLRAVAASLESNSTKAESGGPTRPWSRPWYSSRPCHRSPFPTGYHDRDGRSWPFGDAGRVNSREKLRGEGCRRPAKPEQRTADSRRGLWSAGGLAAALDRLGRRRRRVQLQGWATRGKISTCRTPSPHAHGLALFHRRRRVRPF